MKCSRRAQQRRFDSFQCFASLPEPGLPAIAEETPRAETCYGRSLGAFSYPTKRPKVFAQWRTQSAGGRGCPPAFITGAYACIRIVLRAIPARRAVSSIAASNDDQQIRACRRVVRAANRRQVRPAQRSSRFEPGAGRGVRARKLGASYAGQVTRRPCSAKKPAKPFGARACKRPLVATSTLRADTMRRPRPRTAFHSA
jgi:hypothetical protein